MPLLRRRIGDRAAARNALGGRQRYTPFDVPHEQVERALRVRLDQLELRERVLVRLDVVAVLHLVQTVRGPATIPTMMTAIAIVVALLLGRCRHFASVYGRYWAVFASY